MNKGETVRGAPSKLLEPGGARPCPSAGRGLMPGLERVSRVESSEEHFSFLSQSQCLESFQSILGEKLAERLLFVLLVFGYRTGVGKGQEKFSLRGGSGLHVPPAVSVSSRQSLALGQRDRVPPLPSPEGGWTGAPSSPGSGA